MNKHFNKLSKIFNKEINYSLLYEEANKINDASKLRILYLGLKIGQNNSNKKWIYNFYKLFSQVKCYNNIWSKFTIWNLGDKKNGVINYCNNFSDCEKAIQDIIDLYIEFGDNIAKSAAQSAAWSAAESARSAVESARSAAQSAAEAAWSAAQSAAEAAWSAAEAAAEAAWSAAEAVESARSAAQSAAEAAWSAVWKNQGEYLLKLLKEKINV